MIITAHCGKKVIERAVGLNALQARFFLIRQLQRGMTDAHITDSDGTTVYLGRDYITRWQRQGRK